MKIKLAGILLLQFLIEDVTYGLVHHQSRPSAKVLGTLVPSREFNLRKIF